MVQEDTCSTSEAIDCERNKSVTSGSSYRAVKISAGRRALQRAPASGSMGIVFGKL